MARRRRRRRGTRKPSEREDAPSTVAAVANLLNIHIFCTNVVALPRFVSRSCRTRVRLTRHARLPRVARGGGARRARLRRRRGLGRGRRVPRARPDATPPRLRGGVRYERAPGVPISPAVPRPVLPDSDARTLARGCFLHVRHRPRQGHVLRPYRVRARGRHAARRPTRHPPREYQPKQRGVERGRLRRVSHRRPCPDDDRRRVRGRPVRHRRRRRVARRG
mmetsp:Transcript_4586/g.18875  ORF Transcript_4586/g.18875 Transcript_4586/m.18875 type:complete len:221 (-) Transcript_4586:1282-1944(-)